MKKIVLMLIAFPVLLSCGGDEKKGGDTQKPVSVKRETTKDEEEIDSTEIKRRQAELLKQDSIQRAEEELSLKRKQECATKVVFLENFYTEYFNNPESAIRQCCSDRLISELRSQASNYEGNRMPVWAFSSGDGGNIQWKVNIPNDEKSNVFVIDIVSGGRNQKVYLTVVGSNGYYTIDRVKNPAEGYGV
ncbi:MAG: hypothetical protein IJ607_03430 [Bacteroidaceae bacterium]|nr:hypothetical protein [Bacteroidaceae bacterium]